jgi:hypothetical protein
MMMRMRRLQAIWVVTMTVTVGVVGVNAGVNAVAEESSEREGGTVADRRAEGRLPAETTTIMKSRLRRSRRRSARPRSSSPRCSTRRRSSPLWPEFLFVHLSNN